MMTDTGNGAVDPTTLLDLMLMQQARLFDLSNRKGRLESRDRLQRLFIDLQALIQPSMTLEIGAMGANFSRSMAARGIPGFAFEANPYTFRRFKEPLSKAAPTLSYRHCAISDVDGEVTFEVKSQIKDQPVALDLGNNSLLKRQDDHGVIKYESVTVPSLTLDSFLAAEGLTDRSFSAWIDVEGALSKVTGGVTTALSHCQSLLVELEDLPYWDGQMLYHEATSWFVGQGLVPVARDFEGPHQFNVMFLRAERLQHPKIRLALTRFLGGEQGSVL